MSTNTLPMNKTIDHTLLKAEATPAQIIQLCQEAKKYQFFSVCVNSSMVKTAAHELRDSGVLVCTVVGFPLGAMSTKAKAFETKCAIEDGAGEIDMVINLGMAKSGQWDELQKDIEEVVKAAHPKRVKVILETCLLTDDEIKKASLASLKARAHFVKTSTGFSTGGATPHAVELMKSVVTNQMEIKASGGIRDLETAKMYLNMGVTRLGTSSGVLLMEGKIAESGY